MREFNVTGTCIPTAHYMVDTTNKLEQIKNLIDRQKYFTINRGRQYGKTTTLALLDEFLAAEYTVISISFEGIDVEEFESAATFSQTFIKLIVKALRFTNEPKEYQDSWKNDKVATFSDLSDHITDMCEGKKLVLLIDEVDKSSNNRVFLGFLGKLREKYLARARGKDFTFHSVILAGVYDIKNIKLRLVQEGLHTPGIGETTINNSPWNIAADFDVDMSFSAVEIESMLISYDNDHQTGMDISAIAQEIYDYTGGYPVLVSNICKKIDEKLDQEWSTQTVRKSVKLILKEDTPLFQSIIRTFENDEELAILTYQLLMLKEKAKLSYNVHNPLVAQGARYGYFKEVNGRVVIANKIFEMVLTNYLISLDEQRRIIEQSHVKADEDGIITADGFNMQLCLERFAKYYHLYYNDRDVEFLEREASKLLLMFLSSILNGSGFVYIEAGLADGRAMDIVATYHGTQFIVETKIWYGPQKHEEALIQLEGYMDKLSLTEGYLLTFDFRKEKQKQQQWVTRPSGRQIYEVRV